MTAKKGTTMRMNPDQKLAIRTWACYEMFEDIVETDIANWNTYSSSEKLHQLWTINRTLSPGKLLRYLFQLLGILIASSHKVSGCIQTIADMQYFNKETHI